MNHTKVLVIRTSRFAGLAVRRAREVWPGAEIRVLRQEGPDAELDAILIPRGDCIEMPRGPIRLGGVLFSPWGRIASRWRPDHVMVQWSEADGIAHAAVNRVALWLQPRGFHALLKDGSHTVVSPARELVRSLRVVVLRLVGIGIIVGVGVAAVVLWPVAAWHRGRERHRLRAA